MSKPDKSLSSDTSIKRLFNESPGRTNVILFTFRDESWTRPSSLSSKSLLNPNNFKNKDEFDKNDLEKELCDDGGSFSKEASQHSSLAS